ncbi:MAG: hypothetical protein ACUVWN_16660 [bacterium]
MTQREFLLNGRFVISQIQGFWQLTLKNHEPQILWLPLETPEPENENKRKKFNISSLD